MNNYLISPNLMESATNNYLNNYNWKVRTPQTLTPCGFAGFLIYSRPGALVLLTNGYMKKIAGTETIKLLISKL